MSRIESIVRTSPRKPATRTRCQIAHGSHSLFTDEMARLLHKRLRIVSLLALLPLGLFLLRAVVDPGAEISVSLVLHASVVMLVAVFATLLWSHGELPPCSLHKMELGIFASILVLFSWAQFEMFHEQSLFEVASHNHNLHLVRLYIQASATRWFFLIVIYGVFIPSSWQRCALLTGATACLPLVLTPLGAYCHDHLCSDLPYAMFDLVVLMGTAVAVAIFGAMRFDALQREAFKARQLGQYRLIRKIGSGGMGEVYEAEHTLLSRRCALKMIREDQVADPDALTRFEREVQAMARLTHPNTVEVYDYGHTEEGTFYYVMEYLPGQTLESLVNHSGPMPAARVIHFLRQVCGALREAHMQGLLHRDIKPSNIIACQRGGIHDVAKLLDFGLVQSAGLAGNETRLTIQGAVLGSPPYMSPEQAVGRADLDARADIYCLGGVGYFLLTGRPPFVRETAMEMLLAHAYEPLVAPSAILNGSTPADLEAVLARCLAKKREDRFATVADLDRALAACADAGKWTEEQAETLSQHREHAPDTQTHAVPTMVHLT